MSISIIIPTLNDEKAIMDLLQQLQAVRLQGNEVIVVDGGSHDKTISVSEPLADKVISSESGRALQMNNGANQASENILWFLHADTIIPANAVENIHDALSNKHWGRFNVKLSGTNRLFRLIESMINIRSCLFGIATGDQGIFVKKNIFESVGHYSILPLMEDVELSKKLKRVSRPACIKEKLITSSRRWEKNGVISTVLLMWRLRFLYWLGVNATTLAKQYK